MHAVNINHRTLAEGNGSRIQASDLGSLQMFITTTKGISTWVLSNFDLSFPDIILRLPLRAIVYDAVLSHLINTRSYTETARLCRSSIEFVGGEDGNANITEDE